ncbi:MAG TPA: T9SS type A sorting domain-containing protein [Bacteroidia bacterium]|nr:T9SS type A sorting domain-containing protein [Bacteroidia bacterium]
MKKIYTLLFVTLLLAASADAQRMVGSSFPVKAKNPYAFAPSQNQTSRTSSTNDTLTLHFMGTPSLYGSQGGGFVSGQNGYGDLAKMQLFDGSYGVIDAGVITGILFYMGWVEGDPNSVITATIWDDSGGTPGSILGTAPVLYSSMDTTVAGYFAIASAPGPAFYNGIAVFATPIPIPAGGSFFAGFSFTYAAGDTVGLTTTNDPTGGDAPGITGDFPDAATHTWEEWSDNSFNSYNAGAGTWQLDIAQGIFPTVDFGVGIQKPSANNGFSLNQNYPNPAAGETMISYSLDKTADVSFTIADVTGRTVSDIAMGSQAQGSHKFTFDTRSLNAGVYFLTMNADGTRLTTRMMVAK